MALQDEWDNATPIKSDLSSAWDSASPIEEEKSLMSKIADRYKKVHTGHGDIMSGRTLVEGTGQTIGAIGDVAMSGLGKFLDVATPEPIKKEAGSLAGQLSKSQTGKALLASMGYYGDLYQGWKKKNPDAAVTAESIANIASVVPIGKGAQLTKSGLSYLSKSEGANILSDATKLAMNAGLGEDALEKIANNQTAQVVKRSFEKAGIKPKDPVMAQKFYDMGAIAVPDIIKYAPENIAKSERPLETVVEAIERARKGIFAEADDLTRQAGASGMPNANQLATVEKWLHPNGEDFTTLTKHRPELYKELIDLKKNIESGRPQTAVQMQSEIKHFNSIAGNREKFSNIDRQLNNDLAVALRTDLEKGLENLGISGRSDLMKRYGAIKEVEKQLAKASVNAYGKQPYSYLDVLSASGGFMGLVTTNPSLILASTTTAGTLHGLKYLKDPQRILKNMFKDVEKINTQKDFASKLKSRYMKNKISAINGIGVDNVDESFIGTRDKLSRDTSGIRPTPLSLPMPERGFILHGEPYGEVIRPIIKKPSGAIDAEFSSTVRGLLGRQNKDAVYELPYQGFEIIDDVIPNVSRVKLRQAAETFDIDNLLKFLNLPR